MTDKEWLRLLFNTLSRLDPENTAKLLEMYNAED